MKMQAYRVEIKNISANVATMKIAQGDTQQSTVRAEDAGMAIQTAVSRAFDECRFETELKNGDGSRHGWIVTQHARYGRIYVYAEPEDAAKVREAARALGRIRTPRKAAASANNLAAYRGPLKACTCNSEPHKSTCPIYQRDRQRESRARRKG